VLNAGKKYPKLGHSCCAPEVLSQISHSSGLALQRTWKLQQIETSVFLISMCSLHLNMWK